MRSAWSINSRLDASAVARDPAELAASRERSGEHYLEAPLIHDTGQPEPFGP